MKLFKKTLCVLLAVLLLSCTAMIAFAEDGGNVVSLRVEGITDCLFYGDVTVSDGATALDALKAADAVSDDLTLTVTESEYGSYLAAINGLYAGSQTEKGWDGWMFRVNGVAPEVGINAFVVKGGDVLVVYYSDEYGETGMYYPVLDDSLLLTEGKLSFTSTVTDYDPVTWEPTVQEVTIKGYTLIWDGARIQPDENGVVTLTEAQLQNGDHSVQIERYAQNGLPTVLRFAPDYSIKIEKSTEDPGTNDTQDQQDFFAKILNVLKGLFQKIIDFFKGLFNK